MRKILWEPWEDPMAPLLEEWRRDHPPGEDEDDPEFQKAQTRMFGPRQLGPGFAGPFGIVPLRESILPSKLWNLWMIHVSFRITYRIRRVICKVPGVESCCVFSSYRARIGIGKVFDTKDVQRGVEKSLNDLPSDLDSIVGTLRHKYRHWAVLEVGEEIKLVGGETEDEVKQKSGNSNSLVSSWFS